MWQHSPEWVLLSKGNAQDLRNFSGFSQAYLCAKDSFSSLHVMLQILLELFWRQLWQCDDNIHYNIFFRIHNIYFMNITIKTELLKLGLWMNTKWTWWIISFLYWYIYSVIIYRYILYGNYLFILILHCPFVKQKKMESVSLFTLFKERVKSLWMFKSNGSPLPFSLSASTLRYTVLILLYLLCTSENRTHTHEDTGIDKPNVITLPFETSRNCSSPQLHHHFPFCSCFKFAVYWILQISSNDVASTLTH